MKCIRFSQSICRDVLYVNVTWLVFAFIIIGLIASFFCQNIASYNAPDQEILYYSETAEEHIQPVPESALEREYADNELLVLLSNSPTEQDAQAFAQSYGAELVGFMSVSGLCQWRLNDPMSYMELCELADELRQLPEVDAVCLNTREQEAVLAEEPGTMEQLGSIVNDIFMGPYSSENAWYYSPEMSWGYKDIHADAVYDTYLDAMVDPINVGVLDAGFQDHYDITSPKYSAQGGEDPAHGTHVTGIIWANCQNDTGMRGVYPNPTQDAFLETGVWCSDLTVAKLYETAGLIKDGCKVINMSFGLNHLIGFLGTMGIDLMDHDMLDMHEQFLSVYINRGYEFLIVVSAGNDSKRGAKTGDYYFSSLDTNNNIRVGTTYGLEYAFYSADTDKWELKKFDENDPQRYMRQLEALTGIDYTIGEETIFGLGSVPTVYSSYLAAITLPKVKNRIIIVGAYDRDHKIADFSNMDERVDIMAPGVNIYSTMDNRIKSLQGTSMSAPYVTGAIACIWSLDSSMTAAEVRSLLMVEWPRNKGSDAEKHIKENNDMVQIGDDGFSNVTKPALNLKASMELATLYVAKKHEKNNVPDKESQQQEEPSQPATQSHEPVPVTKDNPEPEYDISALIDTCIKDLVQEYGIVPTGFGFFETPISGAGNAFDPLETSGMLFADVYDYDDDGQQELLVMRNEPLYFNNRTVDTIHLEMYEFDKDGYTCSDRMAFTATNLSCGGYWRSLTVFRYSNAAQQLKTSIGLELYSQFNSETTTLASLTYTNNVLTQINAVGYGEWPGSDEYRTTCFFVPASYEGAILDMEAVFEDPWKINMNSEEEYDEIVTGRFGDMAIDSAGLTVQQIRSVYNDYNGTGGLARDSQYCYMTAKDCYASLIDDITELGSITTQYGQAQQTLVRTDYLGSLDAYR